MDEALKPESPSSEKDSSDALLFCLDSNGKMILTGVQEDLSLESAGEQSTISMTMNIITLIRLNCKCPGGDVVSVEWNICDP